MYLARSDNASEFRGKFAEVCRKHGIKQEFTPPHTPKYNGVAERGLGLITDAALAGRIQAKELYADAPTFPALWAESIACACHQLNCSASSANPERKSPFEMFHGRPPPIEATQPFLKPAVFRKRRKNKSQPKAQKGWYLGPAHNHPRDCVRMLTEDGRVITTRDFTWRHVPAAPPAPPQLMPLADEEGYTDGEGEGMEGASRQGGGGEEDLDSESGLDVAEVRGLGRATSSARKQAPATPGNGTQGDEGSVPPPPPSEGGDFGGDGKFSSPTSSSSEPDDSGSSSSSSEPGDSGSSGDGSNSEPDDRDRSNNEAGGGDSDSDVEELAAYDPADGRYPSGNEGKKLAWTASSGGLARHELERGRTRKQTRELESALCSYVLDNWQTMRELNISAEPVRVVAGAQHQC